jgi:3-phosphoshikimate 1-carboxyvinyltransferase
MKRIAVKAPKRLFGEITLPGDKSISHRAVILGAIAQGETQISGLLASGDIFSTIRILRKLGVNFRRLNQNQVIVRGVGRRGLKEPSTVLNAGNSGTTMRFLIGLLSGQRGLFCLWGDRSLSQRPMGRVIIPLREMGAQIWAREDRLPPVVIKGTSLHSLGEYKLPIASAQVKSALLLASLNTQGETTIIEPIKSRDHTERLLRYLGAEIKIDGLKISLKGGGELKGKEIFIPGDISSASFFIAAALLVPRSEIVIKKVGINSTRLGFIKVVKKMGAEIEIFNLTQLKGGERQGDIRVKFSSLKGIKITERDIPSLIDEVPILALLSAYADGESVIRGAKELRVKESDRIKSIVINLKALGADIEELEDGLIIRGKTHLRGGVKLRSFGDHRIAMTGIIAGLTTSEEIVVEGTECIRTSFPEFTKILNSLNQAETFLKEW